MRVLDQRLAQMDARLKREEIARDARLTAITGRAQAQAKDAAEKAVGAQARPEQLRALAAKALARAEPGEGASDAPARTPDDLEPRLEALIARPETLDDARSEPPKP
jgi:hypothetical protein